MRILSLGLALLLMHLITPAAHGAMGALHHRDSSGGTNLQKISALLKESKESQDNETARRINNVAVAQASLSNCANLAGCGERTACKEKYSAIVSGALRACGADCP